MNISFEYCVQNERIHYIHRKGLSPVRGKEFHDYHEFVLFAEGKSHLISKEIQQDLKPGSLIIIPKAQFHQFCIEHPENYERCILGFYETPELSPLVNDIMTGVKVIALPDKRLTTLFIRLTETAKSSLPENEKNMFVKASLVQLLIYLKQYSTGAISKNINISPIVQQALSMIDKSFAKSISVESIAKALYVSPSTLAHKFSKELNISVYRYITQKRLYAACEYIQKGDSPITAAEKCGFSDYSCFYRIYKKQYNDSPSKLQK